jgi:small subunit ribosomal protein S1
MTIPDSTQNETAPSPASPDAATSHAPSTAAAEPVESTANGTSESASGSGEHAENGAQGGAHGGATDPSSAQAGEHAAEHEDGDEPEGDDSGAEPAAADGASPVTGEKKRRRRRRKKHGAAAAGGEAPAGADAAANGEPVAEGADAPAADGAPTARTGEKQAKRKERKPGPPRERPPVNGGDIVFGKIIAITDDAIVIDIPGKAHAIFDRREMLISDEDAGAAPPAPRDESASEATAAPVPGATDGSDLPGQPPEAVEGAAAPEASEAAAHAEAPIDATPPAEVPAPAEAAAPHEGEPAPAATESPKDPKVPRVILEVGADFIGVVHNDGARGGLVVLTHHPRRYERAKTAVEKAFNDKALIEGLVTGVIKGGIEVDVDGLRAFAPGSHVELRLGSDLTHLVAQRLPFTVTQYAKRGRDVVLSRRSMLEEEAKRSRTEALAKLKVGETVDGTVRSVVAFGAFVDVGGVEGLVPLQEMSHNRADGPSDVFKVGETTSVVVMKVDDKGKVWLSHKATIPDPWQLVAKKYAAGTRHAGKVVRIQPFGAFIELEPGIDGLLHTADLSIKRIETPDEVVKVGDALDVVVAHVDPYNHKIALHPAPQGAAADEPPQKVLPHKGVKAKIELIEVGGLVVRILGVTGRNARGYVTAAGTGTPRGTELRKSFHVGQVIDAKVIEIDPRRGEIKLSIKALSDDQERSAYQQYRQQLKAEARFTFGDLLAKKGVPPR